MDILKNIIIMATVCCAVALSGMSQTRELVILHTNDTHSTVLPLSANLKDTLKVGRGGFLRRVAMIKDERAKNPDLLLFDSGDFSQGSPFYTLFEGKVEIELMNMMGYDAVTIGNHEFDFGLERMAELFRKADFPVVCANYDFKGTPVDGIVKPYVVLERDGLRIGVFGVSPRLDGLVSEKNCRGVKYLNPVDVACTVSDKLRFEEKCDVVVCLSHLGWGVKGDADDRTLVSVSRNIDIVLGGHSHSYFEDLQWVKNYDGRNIPVDQNGKHGIFVGKMVMKLEK